METESRMVVVKGWLGGRMGMYCSMGTVPVLENERSSGDGGP